jgi:hypothetical protein
VIPGYGPRAAALVALGVLGLAGCGGSSASTDAATSAPAGGAAVQAYTAEQLKAALLPSIHGFTPSRPAESGALGELAFTRSVRQAQAQVTVSPASCRSWPDFDALAKVPTAAVSMALRKGAVVSETLMAPSAALTRTALGAPPSAACRRYRLIIMGGTSIVAEARGPRPSFGTTGYSTRSRSTNPASLVWKVAFASHGYVAEVSISTNGTAVSAREALVVARTAYDRAERVLR